MSLLESWGGQIPLYDNALYLKGYGPYQIMRAKRKEMMADYADSGVQFDERILEAELEKALGKAMGQLFKGWK